MPRAVVDITGQRFGMLEVIEPAGRASNGSVLWRCKCDCGGEARVTKSSLEHQRQQSCGCLRKIAGRKNRRHGMFGTPEYQTWANMLDRCNNPRSALYPNYGGRGITVCEEWLSFEVFYADMGPRPGPDLSIDRIDNDGNYEPGNCRWATVSEQATNRRSTRWITYDDRTQSLTQWAEEVGITKQSLSARIKKHGVVAEASR